MAAGELLIAQVLGLLVPSVGKNTAEIHQQVTLPASPRAIRYAIKALVEDGKAIRKGSLIFAAEPASAEAA